MAFTANQIRERATALGIQLTLSPNGETIHIKIPKQCKVDTRKMLSTIREHKDELLTSLRQAAKAEEIIAPERCIRCQSPEIYDYIPLSSTKAVTYCETCTPGTDPHAHLIAHTDLLRDQSPLREASMRIYHISEIEALKRQIQANASSQTNTPEDYWQSVSRRLEIPPRYHQPVTENGKRARSNNGNSIYELGKPMMSQQEWSTLHAQQQTERPEEARFSHYKAGYADYCKRRLDGLTEQTLHPDEELLEKCG